MSTIEQLAFDIETMIREADLAAAPAWVGALLAFTLDYYSPDELDAAFERYKFENGHFACIPRSHMWHRAGYEHDPILTARGHSLHLFDADTRCEESDHDHTGEDLPGRHLSQTICAGCRWHAIGTGNAVVEAWHDHAMPGWRELPILPEKLRGQMGGTTTKNKKAMAWLAENYPADWCQPGHPIRTRRDGHATAHVLGYSPFGGYDLAE